MEAIVSLRKLAFQIGIPVERLRTVAGNVASHYRQAPRRIGPDKVRILRIPDTELMDIQRRIKKKVLDPLTLSKHVHGGVRGRSPRSNATCHLGQPCVVTLDVRKFFDKVRHPIVYRTFRDLGFGEDVASLLTRLTTLDSRLPQGSPTSTAVANLVLAMPVDEPISKQADRLEVRYTRFVDDLVFSGSNPKPLINVVGRYLSRRRLQMYRKNAKRPTASKMRITPRSRPQEVTGLLVNSDRGPSISRKRRDNIRAAIFNLRNSSANFTEVRSILGRIAHVRQFNPGAALRLTRCLSAVVEVPSPKRRDPLSTQLKKNAQKT